MAGLAGKVRGARDSDEFDLAGYNLEKCHALAKAAFGDPLELGQMVRLSFTVGGGKLTRQKYTDALPKEFMVALTESAGYSQDDAAALTLESGGTFKYQHDTNKNLKFVHVYPRLVPPAAAEAGGEDGVEAEERPRTPAETLAECEMDDFRRLLEARVPTYAGKKRVLEELKSRLAKLESAEKKLVERQALDDEEQALYDTLSIDTLKLKSTFVSNELQKMAESGSLTADEKAQVLEQFDEKLEALEEQLKKADADGKAKLVTKIQEGKEKLQKTIASVKANPACQPPPVRHGPDIQKYRIRLAGLTKLEQQKGTYTIEQLRGMSEKPELEDAVKELERRSRFWFETDAELQARLDIAMKQDLPKKKQGGGGGGGGAGSSGGGWSTAGKKR